MGCLKVEMLKRFTVKTRVVTSHISMEKVDLFARL